MIESNLDFGRTPSAASVTELQRQFPKLPVATMVTLAIMALLARSVTPFRLCGCGCCEPVTGKAVYFNPACRKRLERERRALRAGGARQINIALQYEMPVTIPHVPAPADFALPPMPAPDGYVPNFSANDCSD